MTAATTPHPGFKRSVSGMTIHVSPGDKFWMCSYQHSSSALRCAVLTEPTEVTISAFNSLVDKKGRIVQKYYDGLYATEQECREAFDFKLRSHLRALVQRSKESLIAAEKILSKSPHLRGSKEYNEFKRSLDD